MSNFTWKDAYGDSEGLACALDIWSNVLAEQGSPGPATDVRVTATALREQAAEIERLQADAIHTCHANCQRTACVLRRRVDELEAQLATARQQANQEPTNG